MADPPFPLPPFPLSPLSPRHSEFRVSPVSSLKHRFGPGLKPARERPALAYPIPRSLSTLPAPSPQLPHIQAGPRHPPLWETARLNFLQSLIDYRIIIASPLHAPDTLPKTMAQPAPSISSSAAGRGSGMDPATRFRLALSFMSMPSTRDIKPTSDEKLLLYGLYKQALLGDCQGSRPAIWDVVGRQKWDAWSKFRGIGQTEAKIRYVDTLVQILKRHPERDQVLEYINVLQGVNDENIKDGYEVDSGDTSDNRDYNQRGAEEERGDAEEEEDDDDEEGEETEGEEEEEEEEKKEPGIGEGDRAYFERVEDAVEVEEEFQEAQERLTPLSDPSFSTSENEHPPLHPAPALPSRRPPSIASTARSYHSTTSQYKHLNRDKAESVSRWSQQVARSVRQVPAIPSSSLAPPPQTPGGRFTAAPPVLSRSRAPPALRRRPLPLVTNANAVVERGLEMLQTQIAALNERIDILRGGLEQRAERRLWLYRTLLGVLKAMMWHAFFDLVIGLLVFWWMLRRRHPLALILARSIRHAIMERFPP
ncbi:uncharacterized protein VTP21DRAFT_3726 [Calcarisporiella thermophila]|uniref:uncharacterized protein n=1 Tax=Calcarisporiella thermophila TaxID=911321 RepID=UPI0037439C61